MLISSWNVNSVRARILNITEYLKKFSPDVLMIQEIKTEDKNSADLLKGSEVDYAEELIGNSFKISNPQSKSSCGCGVSFSL